VGLGLDQAAPDHSSLSRFRERLTQQEDLEIFEQLLAEIVQIAVKSGIQLGSIQVIDGVHSEANVNTAKDHKRKEDGKGPQDLDAKWGLKANNGSRIKKVRMWIK